MSTNYIVNSLLVSLMLMLTSCSYNEYTVHKYHHLNNGSNNFDYKKYKFVDVSTNKNIVYSRILQDEIKKNLLQHGYIEYKNPDILVRLNYGIDSKDKQVEYVPIYRQDGLKSKTTTLDPYTNSVYTRYNTNKTIAGYNKREYNIYKKGLTIEIIDDHTKDIIYVAKVENSENDSSLDVNLVDMVKCIFKDFPGKSGKVTKCMSSVYKY